jgi:hypothetical protein
MTTVFKKHGKAEAAKPLPLYLSSHKTSVIPNEVKRSEESAGYTQSACNRNTPLPHPIFFVSLHHNSN